MQQHMTVVPPRASRTPFPKPQTEDLPLYDDDEQTYDDETPLRPPTSARRYHTKRPPQAPPVAHQQAPSAFPSPVKSWYTIKRRILKGLLVVLLLALFADTLGYVAWQHWQHGDYPTSHLSANFRHGGTSDLVAFTSGQDVEIMEFVGKQAHIYAIRLQGLIGHRLVTLDVLDVNADGKPDLLVDIDGVAQRPCLLNTGRGFVWSLAR